MVDKVGYTRPIATPKAVRRAGAAASSGFADALSQAEGAAEIEATEAASGMAATGNLGGLIGLQEVDEREHRRRRAVKRGRLTLDALANLRDALLMGVLPISTIEKLEKIVEQERSANTDPVLAGILDDIEVRAAVEIAKLEMAGVLRPAQNIEQS
jgi:hypothetical protein